MRPGCGQGKGIISEEVILLKAFDDSLEPGFNNHMIHLYFILIYVVHSTKGIVFFHGLTPLKSRLHDVAICRIPEKDREDYMTLVEKFDGWQRVWWQTVDVCWSLVGIDPKLSYIWSWVKKKCWDTAEHRPSLYLTRLDADR